MVNKPEDKAREVIDKMLENAGWHVCHIGNANLNRSERLRQSILKKRLRGGLCGRKGSITPWAILNAVKSRR